MTSDESEHPGEGHGQIAAPSGSAPAQETKTQGPLVQVDIKATATDVLGLGAAAKTPAGEAIARGFFPSLGYALMSASNWVFERRNARTAAERIVLEARAHAEASLITAQAEQRISALKLVQAPSVPEGSTNLLVDGQVETLRIAAGERVLATEIRRQESIHSVVAEAMDIASQSSPGDKPNEIPQDFASKVIDAVGDVSAPNVRSIYARLIASQVKPDPNRISNPSLELLKSLDGALALSFEKFVLRLYYYEGNHPPLRCSLPDSYRKHLPMLKEIGIITEKNTKQFNLREFYLTGLGVDPSGVDISIPDLSVRGWEIAAAIFDSKYIDDGLLKYPVSDSEALNDVLCVIQIYINTGCPKVEFGIRDFNGAVHYFIVINKIITDKNNYAAFYNGCILDIEQFDKHNINVSAQGREVIKNVISKFTMQVSDG